MYYDYDEEKDELKIIEPKRPYPHSSFGREQVSRYRDYGEFLVKDDGYTNVKLLKHASNYISQNTLNELNGPTELEVVIIIETVGYEEEKLSSITVEVYRPRVLISHVDKEF